MTARRRRAPRLPSAGVSFRRDFLERLGRFALRVGLARERREGAGGARLLGVGAEFVGYRPYRPGEDLRLLDWGVYARSGKPFVRVARREASERWGVVVDTSASMGVGRPGKLQCAAETACALAALALHLGATITVWTTSEGRSFRLQKKTGLVGWLSFLEEERARGERGLAHLLREPGRLRDQGRLFLLGDLQDLEPAHLEGALRRGRELFCAALLAPEELNPPLGLGVEWADAEDGERLALWLDRGLVARYEERLGARLEEWGAFSARHGIGFGTWCSDASFETIVGTLLGQRG